MRTWMLLLALPLLLHPTGGFAQEDAEDSSVSLRAWQVGASIGLPGFEGKVAPLEFLTVAFLATNAAQGRPGLDFAAGTIPRFLGEGVVSLGLRAGVTAPFGTGGARIWPSAGLSLAAVAGGGGGGAIGGGYIGAALTFLDSGSSTRPRLGVTLHRLENVEGMLWLIEFGFMSRRK